MIAHRFAKARRWGLMVAIPLAVLGAERVLHGAVDQFKVWQDGELLTAKDLNANFAALRSGAALPPKTVVQAFLTAADVSNFFDTTGAGLATGPYNGWALCNGKNGTPDLGGRFVRINNAAAGAVGGTDSLAHTHAIDHDHAVFASAPEAAHTHGVPAHQHTLPVGFDASNVYFTGNADGNPIYGSSVVTANRAYPAVATGTFATSLTRQAFTDNSAAANTAPGSSHAHNVDVPAFAGASGPSSATDNRPAFLELTALMRL